MAIVLVVIIVLFLVVAIVIKCVVLIALIVVCNIGPVLSISTPVVRVVVFAILVGVIVVVYFFV